MAEANIGEMERSRKVFRDKGNRHDRQGEVEGSR